MSSSVGIMTFPIWWESHKSIYKSHVPNHQFCHFSLSNHQSTPGASLLRLNAPRPDDPASCVGPNQCALHCPLSIPVARHRGLQSGLENGRPAGWVMGRCWNQWVLRENLHRKPWFFPPNMCFFPVDFPVNQSNDRWKMKQRIVFCYSCSGIFRDNFTYKSTW